MREKTYFAIGALSVLVGYAVGVLAVFLGEGTDRVSFSDASLQPDWLRAFASGPLFVIGAVACGVCFFGWLAVYPLLFYKSYALGYSAGLLLASFGMRGMLPLGLCLFPSAAAECMLLVRASSQAFESSFRLFRGSGEGARSFYDGLCGYLMQGLTMIQCSSFVLIWDLFLSPCILAQMRELL